MSQGESSYEKVALPDGKTRFVVTPAESKPPMFGSIFLAVSTGLLLSLFNLIAFLIVATGTFVGFRSLYKYLYNKKREVGGAFVVAPDTIEIEQRTRFAASDIHRLILRNSFDDTIVWTGGAGLAGAMVNSAAAQTAELTRIGYKLVVEAGGKATTLAGGMNETTAYGLLTDVSRILGFKTT